MSESIDSILQEHADALARRELARQAFVEANADAEALTAIIREQGQVGVPGASLDYQTDWLRAGERASEALFKTLLPTTSPQQIFVAHKRWAEFLSRLLRDKTETA